MIILELKLLRFIDKPKKKSKTSNEFVV